MINAVINHGDGTLVLELPHNIYGIHEKLMSMGYSGGPHRVPLTDNEGDALRVKLYGADDTGNHLLRLLTEQNTLADANTMAFVVQNASADIKEKLTEKIAADRYDSLPELVADIRQMTYDAGPVKQTYYCPLTAELVDEDDYSSTVSNRFLRDYAEMIREAVAQERDRDDQDMAEYYHGDDGLKSKLASMVWGVELYRGRLFGKIDCSFKEALIPAEEELLKDYITGQNSDGWGEGFEQRPLETEDGDLYVSFWNSGDDYSIMTHDELDEYIANEGMQMGGM